MKTQYDDKLLLQERIISELTRQLTEVNKERAKTSRLAILEAAGITYGDYVNIVTGDHTVFWRVPSEQEVLNTNGPCLEGFHIHSFIGNVYVTLAGLYEGKHRIDKLPKS